MTTPLICRLSPAHASTYRALRLRALQENPQAFTSDAQEEAAQPLAWSVQRLTPDSAKLHDFFLGAFLQDELIGMVGLAGRYRVKERHNATVLGMYVAPEHAGQGLGARLLAALLDKARQLPDLEQLDLTVTQGNPAQALYEAHGFTVFGVHPDAIQVNGQYFTKVLMRLNLRANKTPD
jgi:RimJ/RimL family protein N-acetyltransferase